MSFAAAFIQTAGTGSCRRSARHRLLLSTLCASWTRWRYVDLK